MKRRMVAFLIVLALAGFARAQTIEWSYSIEAPAAAPTLFPSADQPSGVVVTAGTSVIRLDGKGTEVWKSVQPARVATPATVADIDMDESVESVVALSDGTVVCLDQQGQVRWTHAFETPAGGFKVLVAADLTPNRGLEILAGFDDGWLNCLSARGELLWRFFGDRFRVGVIAVGCVDGDKASEIVYGTDNGHIYCLDSFGRVQWRHTELAPYGRSGPNLADLNGDGKPEVLITRSNVGNATCLMALDAVTGAFLWRTKDVMQGYVSNAVVDLDSDGLFEVLHGDKGNNLYCENADGSRRWQTELGGHGLFWAPAVADIDGDGQPEIIACMRGADPRTKATGWVVAANGAIKSELKLGSGANATPAIGDIDGDGHLEAVIGSEGPNQIQALTWNAAGRVGWPSLRGSSRMTGATANGNVQEGGMPGPGTESAPHALLDMRPVGEMGIESGDIVWGDSSWRVSWQDPVPENAFLEVVVIYAALHDETRIIDLRAGATSAAVPVRFVGDEAAQVVIHLHTTDSSTPALVGVREAVPLPPDFCRFDEVAQRCEKAAKAGEEKRADTTPLLTRMAMLRAEQDAIRALASSKASAVTLAEKANKLRAHAAALDAFAGALGDFWSKGGAGGFVCWQDANPWDPFDPEAIPETLDTDAPLTIRAFGNEFEHAVLTLRNVTAAPFDVRCTFADPWPRQTRPLEPEPAKHVTLRRVVPVAAVLHDRVFDALPELDASRALTLPPEEARQLWLTVDTRGLKPGTHELTLYLGSLTKPATFRAIPVRIEVRPIELPEDVFAKINWCSFSFGETSDQARKDMIEHGISVIYGPPLPSIPVAVSGIREGEIDWAEFDRNLARVPAHFTLLWSGPPSCKWWHDAAPAEDSPEYLAGFKTSIQELASHLSAKGFDYRQWAFYPIDEPWNTGFTQVPQLKRFCQRVKNADPKAQVYADPAGLVRVEYLNEFKGLIDIWQPEMNLLKRDPALLEWFHKNAKRLWAYEAPGPAKDLLPLGHYRAFAWFAIKFGLEGAGYWVYRGEDNWWASTDTDHSAVYQTNDQVTPSRRWEADRDGVEDFRAVYVLREEITKARAAGRKEDADRAEALIDEAAGKIVGWQIGSIDEITRMTRDYEIDFNLFLEYRERIAHEILALRNTK